MRLIGSAIVATSILVSALAITGEASATPAPCDPGGITFGMSGYPDGTGVHVPAGMVPVAYPAGIFPWDITSYDDGAATGRDNMVTTVNEYAGRCDGPIHVYGHSYGARTAGDALAILDRGPHASRITGTLTGDPRHRGGVEDTFQGVSIAGITMTGARDDTRTIVVEQHCNQFDGICAFPDPIRDINGAIAGINGYLTGAHIYTLGS